MQLNPILINFSVWFHGSNNASKLSRKRIDFTKKKD